MFWVSREVSWVLRRFEFHETFHEFSDVLSFMRRFMSSQTFWVSWEVSWVLRCFEFHEKFHEFSDVLCFMRRFMSSQTLRVSWDVSWTRNILKKRDTFSRESNFWLISILCNGWAKHGLHMTVSFQKRSCVTSLQSCNFVNFDIKKIHEDEIFVWQDILHFFSTAGGKYSWKNLRCIPR